MQVMLTDKAVRPFDESMTALYVRILAFERRNLFAVPKHDCAHLLRTIKQRQ